MRRLLTAVVVTVLLVAGVIALRGGGDDKRHLTATFTRTTSLYEGANVKVLGVIVGRVDSIEVKGTAVEASISYDADVELPDDVHALIVPPSIVGDRFVQLAPAYAGGATLADGAELGLDRTGVPLELDDTYRAVNELAAALGPEGANSNGALSRLVRAAARNLDGHGRQFNTTLRELAGAISTLAASSGDIDDTVGNLGRITRTFAGNDAAMRRLVTNLARVGTDLSAQRDDITGAVRELRGALRLVARFSERHRSDLARTVSDLTTVSGTLARHTRTLEELVDIGPVGLTSLANIGEPGNWDPNRPWMTPVGGRTTSAAIRGALFEDLGIQFGFAFSGLCAAMPAEQRRQLAAFCDAVESSGGDFGNLLAQLTGKGAGPVALGGVR